MMSEANVRQRNKASPATRSPLQSEVEQTEGSLKGLPHTVRSYLILLTALLILDSPRRTPFPLQLLLASLFEGSWLMFV